MEENKNENAQVNNAETAPVKKTGLFARVRSKFKKEETPATPDGEVQTVPKKTLGQKIKENKGKIVTGAAVAAAVGYGVLKMITTKDGQIDPDVETEPGDWELEDLDQLESDVDSTEEEVNEE